MFNGFKWFKTFNRFAPFKSFKPLSDFNLEPLNRRPAGWL
jgi:hypothetical protein